MSSKLKSIFAALLFAVAAKSSWATSVSSEDKPSLPTDLHYEFTAVPPIENAVINWRRASDLEVPLNDQQNRIITYCWTPNARQPSVDDLDSLKAWLKRNREALAMFNSSLEKPKAQWPERDPQNPQPELKCFSLLIKARIFMADQQTEKGNFSDAAKLLEDNLKLAGLGAKDGTTLIDYLVVCRARTMTQDAMLRLAFRKTTPLPVLEDLLAHLPNLDSETNLYAHVLSIEFTRDYNDSLDLKKLSESFAKMSGTNTALYLSFYPDDLQRAFRVLLDPLLVPLHPKPYDANLEIEQSIRHYRIYRDNVMVPWTERNGEVELDHEIANSNLLQDISPLMELVKNDSLPLSMPAAQKARRAYIQIKNPIGRIIDSSVIGFVVSDLKVCQVRTEREATRACLALMIFERRKGQLPTSLSELVQEKLLNLMPLDPFCGEPLHYSREKRKIWSVSDDGVDDGGTNGKFRWYDKDAVWEVPNINN